MRLSSKLPVDAHNGLTTIAPDLVTRPSAPRFAIVVLDCNKLTTDIDTGTVEPTVRVLRAEIVDAADLPTAHAVMRRAADLRAPQLPLPGIDRNRRDAVDALYEAARDESGTVEVTLDKHGNITGLSIGGEEVPVVDESDRDPLLSEAMDHVVRSQDCDPGALADALGLPDEGGESDSGIARAERILEQLEARGIVSAAGDDGARVVLIQPDGTRVDDDPASAGEDGAQ
ncbi:hypothetical protein EK0264_03630 [Epidermidibacterium keratini]|uniref:FtsK gamma domain-containing protein n=1 Tax=Epidermidibacterium keratini TaxID=1891644 RepID=A0A7L4YJK1_9ACTN|nr:hypothetical protein [Epidermidibacterium keratini]QHB99460.1 hypothetical protein EK0264_03630 [Epidermidibacterium keratini]